MSIYLEGDTFKSKNAIIQNFHIPIVTDDIKDKIIELSNMATELNDNDTILKQIDIIIFKLYNLEFEDIQIIDPETPITREEYENYK